MVNEYASVGGGGPSAGYSGAGGGSAGSSYTGPDMGGGTNAPNTNPVGSDAWWSQEIASRESAARANTSDSPSSSNANVVEPTSPSSYTDPRTGQTFATQAIAESLGYGPTLTAGERTDTYAKELEAAGQTGGYPAQLAYMARHDDPLATPLGISGGGGTSGQDVSAQYLNRPDIYRVTDTKQLALMATGLTAGQAAEQLYQSSKTKSEQRYYETLLRQAETTATGKSAAYHTFAKETGLPHAPNPYEYTADLYVYLEKGYPTSEKERFSPVDYTVLGLSGGKGLNAYVWGDQKHDFTTALDVIAKAEKTGEMGPYGKLGAYSSGYGVLPLSLQQAIGAAAATSPYKETPDKISFDFWGQTPEQMGRGKYVAIGDAGLTKVATGQKVSASGPVVTYTGLPTPFVSGKIEKPTGEVTIPFTDIKFTVPGLAFFQPSTFISGRASEVKEVPYSAMAGPDYTRQYVSSVTGKPVKEFTAGVGAPVVTERIIPETGETEITTTQTYITFPELPQSAKSYTLATTELPSAYETFLSKEFRSRIPTPKEGESLLAVSQLVNPLSQENAPSLAGKAIGYTIMEKLGLDTKPAKETGELVSSLTSPTKGQYTFFYEHPETAVVSYAAGGLFGAGTRGLGAIASKSGKLAAIAPYASKYGGAALGGLYVGGATYEETGGFRTFTPETVAATKARLTQEGIPMAIGFGHGYRLPETLGISKTPAKAAKSATKAAEIKYTRNEPMAGLGDYSKDVYDPVTQSYGAKEPIFQETIEPVPGSYGDLHPNFKATKGAVTTKPTPQAKPPSAQLQSPEPTYTFSRWLTPATPQTYTKSDLALKFAQMEKMGATELSIGGRRGENIKDFETLIQAGQQLGYRVTKPQYEPGIGSGDTGTWVAYFERLPATIILTEGPMPLTEGFKSMENVRPIPSVRQRIGDTVYESAGIHLEPELGKPTEPPSASKLSAGEPIRIASSKSLSESEALAYIQKRHPTHGEIALEYLKPRETMKVAPKPREKFVTIGGKKYREVGGEAGKGGEVELELVREEQVEAIKGRQPELIKERVKGKPAFEASMETFSLRLKEDVKLREATRLKETQQVKKKQKVKEVETQKSKKRAKEQEKVNVRGREIVREPERIKTRETVKIREPERVTVKETEVLKTKEIVHPRITETQRITQRQKIIERPPPVKTPEIPLLPSLPSATGGGGGGMRSAARRYTEKFAVGQGVGYISLAGRKPAPPKPTPSKAPSQRMSVFTAPSKPTRQPATTMRSMAPPTRPVGKTPSVRTNVPTIKKKGRKR